MQWMVPHNRLGEPQLDVLNRCLKRKKGHDWIQGFAGTGKTVLLIHAITEARTNRPELSVCVVVFTHALKDLVLNGIPDYLDKVSVVTNYSFKKNPRHYDLIIVDEVQDLEEDILRLLTHYSNRLIVAGDEAQSIYKDRVSPEDIDEILSPVKYKLVVLYRLTQTLRDIVRTILPNSQIEGARISRMANVQVTLAHAENSSQEFVWVWQTSKKYAKQGAPAAILFPQHHLITQFIDHICQTEGIEQPSYEKNKYDRIDYDPVNEHLRCHDLQLQYLGSGFGSLAESDERPIIYLMTYHSAKGLDYETVFLPYLNIGTSFSQDYGLDRRLFFVAMTRSRRNLFMSYHSNQPHGYVCNMPQDLLHKIDCEVGNKDKEHEDFFF